MFSLGSDRPNPDRIGWRWRRARDASGIDSKWRLCDLRWSRARPRLRLIVSDEPLDRLPDEVTVPLDEARSVIVTVDALMDQLRSGGRHDAAIGSTQ